VKIPELLLLLVLIVLVVRQLPASRFAALGTWGRGPTLPISAGILAATITLWQWGGFRAHPVVYDESAYLLQAELLASGHWSRPSPLVSEAFAQSAVLVTPVLAPKMLPGHAALLALGVLAHLPGLVPVLLVGLTAVLLAILVRRLAGAGTACIAVTLWLTQAGQARWRGSYFSENTTTWLWLLGWWSLLRWRERGKASWLLLLAAVTGWGAITRPLTMIAFVIPVGVVVIRDTIRSGRWGQLGSAIVVGVAFLMIIPLQNNAILGKWNRTPLGLYTRQYLPFDKIGFGYDSTPPLLRQLPVFERGYVGFVARHREHQPDALPRVLFERLKQGAVTDFGWSRRFLVPIAVLGVLVLPAAGWLGVATASLLYALYLGYAHPASWTVYYAEATPVTAAVIAIGLGWLIGVAVGSGDRTGWARGLVSLAILYSGAPGLTEAREENQEAQRPFREFDQQVAAAIPTGRAIVFLRYAPRHNPHVSFHRNVADPEVTRVLTALDLGTTQRAAVGRAYPDRRPYLWDEASGRITADAP